MQYWVTFWFVQERLFKAFSYLKQLRQLMGTCLIEAGSSWSIILKFWTKKHHAAQKLIQISDQVATVITIALHGALMNRDLSVVCAKSSWIHNFVNRTAWLQKVDKATCNKFCEKAVNNVIWGFINLVSWRYEFKQEPPRDPNPRQFLHNFTKGQGHPKVKVNCGHKIWKPLQQGTIYVNMKWIDKRITKL